MARNVSNRSARLRHAERPLHPRPSEAGVPQRGDLGGAFARHPLDMESPGNARLERGLPGVEYQCLKSVQHMSIGHSFVQLGP